MHSETAVHSAPKSEKADVYEINQVEVEDDDRASSVHHVDGIRVLGMSEDDAHFYNSYTPEQRRRIIRKVGFPFNSTHETAKACC